MWQVTPKHACTLNPTKSEWANNAAVQANELTDNLLGNIRPQSSQLTEPLWTESVIKSEISARELMSTLKKKSADGD